MLWWAFYQVCVAYHLLWGLHGRGRVRRESEQARALLLCRLAKVPVRWVRSAFQSCCLPFSWVFDLIVFGFEICSLEWMYRTLFRHMAAVPQPGLSSRWNLFLSHFLFNLFNKQCFFQIVPGMKSFDFFKIEFLDCLLLLALALWQKCVASWCLGGVFIGLRSAMTGDCTAQDKGRGWLSERGVSLSFFLWVDNTHTLVKVGIK